MGVAKGVEIVNILDENITNAEVVATNDGSLTYNAATGRWEITWKIKGTVPPYGWGYREFTIRIPTTLNIGDTLIDKTEIYRDNKTIIEDVFTLTQTVVGAWDPNDKQVSPIGYILPDQTLFYTIFFENVGTAEAINIKIIDTLDNNLDENTLWISDNGVYDATTRTITWNFTNINLPVHGEGHVVFSIKPKPNLPTGTEIKNYATIYFDYMPGINTPTTVNIIDATPDRKFITLQDIIHQLLHLRTDIRLSEVINHQDYIAKIDAAIHKIKDGLKYVEMGNNNLATNMLNTAINQLNALINSIEAQYGKKIPHDLANNWLNRTKEIITKIENVIVSLGGKIAKKKIEQSQLPKEKPQEGLKIESVFNLPNPDKGKNTIFKYKINGEVTQVVIEVYNLAGRLIAKFDGELDGDTNWQTTHLSNGLYIYRIIAYGINGEKVTKVGKLVILR